MAGFNPYKVLMPLVPLMLLIDGNVSAAPSIVSIAPDTVAVGKPHDITIKLNDWTADTRLAITPGGPYLKHTLALEHDIHDLAINNNYAYIAAGKNGLLIFDITDTNAPRIVKHLAIGKAITRIFISAQYAYLGDETHLYSIDISRPDNPITLGKYPIDGSITDFFIDHTYAYVLINQNRLLVLDITTPSAIKMLSRLKLDSRANNIFVDHGHLFMTSGQDGLTVFDINDATAIRQIGHYQTTGPALDIMVSDNTAYVATGKNGLTLLDVTDPTQITWVGSHQQVGNINKVMAHGDQILVANDESRLIVLDVDMPAMPAIHSIYGTPGTLRGVWPTQETIYAIADNNLLSIDFTATPPPLSNEGLDFGQGVNFGGERRLFIRDDIAYVADWFSGIHLYDIRKPERPRLLSSYHTEGSPKGIVVRENYAFVADDDHGLQIINIKDPRNPTPVSSLLTPGLAYTPVLDGDRLYLACHRGGFQIIDIHDVHTPTLISSIDTPGKAWSIQVANNIAYVADDDSGLLIFDVSAPTQPILIGQFNPGGNAEDVLIDNDIAYVAFFDLGLFVLNIKNPAKPIEIGHVKTPGNARGLERKSKLLYIADWLSGIQVVDISDPSNPHIIGSYDTEGAAWGLRIKEHHAFVADWWGGFLALDVHKPQPKFAAHYHATGQVMQTQVKGDYIYAANGAGGLQIFDIKNPLNPTWITGVDLDGKAIGIVIEGGRAYVAQDNKSIAIIDISNPFTAKQIDTIKKDQAHIATPFTDNPVTTHKGVQYISGGKTITAIKLLPMLEIRKQDQNALTITLPGDLPTGTYDIELADPQGNTSTMHNAIEVTLPAFGKPKFTMDDLKKAMKSISNSP